MVIITHIIGILQIESLHFTLHTEPSVSPPEFSMTCRTHGGPATHIYIDPPLDRLLGGSSTKRSQIILDTSRNSVYENTVHVKGIYSGNYDFRIANNIDNYFPTAENVVTERIYILGNIIIHTIFPDFLLFLVAGEPTNLAAESNSTHVTVSWESPGGPVTGYVIYYQSEGRYNSSVYVSGGETESHSLDCLERGVTYYISIVALSDHLPSPLVGPISIIADLEHCQSSLDSTSVIASSTSSSVSYPTSFTATRTTRGVGVVYFILCL